MDTKIDISNVSTLAEAEKVIKEAYSEIMEPLSIIAKTLLHVRETRMWQFKYSSFRDWCETATDYSQRRANQLIRQYQEDVSYQAIDDEEAVIDQEVEVEEMTCEEDPRKVEVQDDRDDGEWSRVPVETSRTETEGELLDKKSDPKYGLKHLEEVEACLRANGIFSRLEEVVEYLRCEIKSLMN